MRIILALLFLTCCLSASNATLKLLKSKIKPAPLASYKAVKYIQQPVVISETIPATYAHPVSTYSAHLSTYSVSPSATTYAVPVQTYAVPHAYEVAVYAQPLAVTYGAHPIVHFAEHQPAYYQPFDTQLVEEHFSHYDDYKR